MNNVIYWMHISFCSIYRLKDFLPSSCALGLLWQLVTNPSEQESMISKLPLKSSQGYLNLCIQHKLRHYYVSQNYYYFFSSLLYFSSLIDDVFFFFFLAIFHLLSSNNIGSFVHKKKKKFHLGLFQDQGISLYLLRGSL